MKMREHDIAECKKTDRKITTHEKFLLRREEINRLFCVPKYRAMSYASLITIGVVIGIQMAMIIWADEIQERAMLFLEGGIGIGAITFGILITTLTYIVFSDYYRTSYHKHNTND